MQGHFVKPSIGSQGRKRKGVCTEDSAYSICRVWCTCQVSDWFSHSVAHDTKPWRGMLETPLGKVYEADEQKVAWEIRGW